MPVMTTGLKLLFYRYPQEFSKFSSIFPQLFPATYCPSVPWIPSNAADTLQPQSLQSLIFLFCTLSSKYVSWEALHHLNFLRFFSWTYLPRKLSKSSTTSSSSGLILPSRALFSPLKGRCHKTHFMVRYEAGQKHESNLLDSLLLALLYIFGLLHL